MTKELPDPGPVPSWMSEVHKAQIDFLRALGFPAIYKRGGAGLSDEESRLAAQQLLFLAEAMAPMPYEDFKRAVANVVWPPPGVALTLRGDETDDELSEAAHRLVRRLHPELL